MPCVAPGYSCTNSLSHYLNIGMNASVVLEDLSAQDVCVSQHLCHSVCARALVSASHRAARLQQYLVLVKLRHT